MVETIRVLSAREASDYNPEEKTLLIRILDSNGDKFKFPSIKNFNSYFGVLEYRFDDVYPNDLKDVPFAKAFCEDDALKLLSDFEPYSDKIHNLVVHCYAGRSRSPAVAAALNNIFGFGLENSFFIPFNAVPNQHVYSTLINTAIYLGKHPVWNTF